MSTGVRTFGTTLNNGGEFYYHRTWSGGDGRWIVTGTKYRPAWTEVRFVTKWYTRRYGAIRYRDTKTLKRVIEHPRKVIGHTKKLDMKWNAYSLSEEISQQSRTLPKNYPTPTTSVGFPLVLSNNAAVTVQNRLVSAVKGHSFNLAVTGAQYGQVLNMVGQTVTRTAKSIHLIKSGRIADASRVLLGSKSIRLPTNAAKNQRRYSGLTQHNVADIWLELQYGWLPLFSDVHAAAESLAYHTDPPRSTRLSVSVTERSSNTTSYTFADVFHEGGVQRRITVELKEQLSVPRSLGLLDPLSVAWEILPFSFVADWFIPIGTYLDNLNVIPNISGRFLTTDVSTIRYLSKGKGGAAGGFASVKKLSVNRVLSASLTVEKPTFKPIEGVFSRGHIANGLALLTQLTK